MIVNQIYGHSGLEGVCYGWNGCVPQNSYVKTTKVMVLGDGIFGGGGELGFDEVMRIKLLNGISTLIRITRELASPLWSLSCEDTTRRWPERGFSPEPYYAGSLILDFQTPDTEKKNVFHAKLPSLWYFCYSSPSSLRVSISRHKTVGKKPDHSH